MSLKIIDFINRHPSEWELLLTEKPYCLKIKRSSFADGRYVMFNYNMLESDNYDPIVAEARGLVLDSADGFKIVRKGFNRFFNYGEGPAAKIDWRTASATLKEDGTLIFLSHYDGRWIWGTRQNFDVAEAELSDALYSTFGALLNDVLAKHYPGFSTDKLVPGLTYCFELCTRFNRIVIDYPDPKIFFLAVFNQEGIELLPDGWVAVLGGIERPKYYKMSSAEDYTALVEGFGVQHEGIVVLDGKGDRIKMKSKLYFDLHKTVSNGAMDREAITALARKGEQAEFLSYFPEYKEKFAEIEAIVTSAYARISEIREQAIRQRDVLCWSRKDFALFHKDDPQAMLWFKAWEDKLTDEFVAGLSDDKFLAFFG